MKVRLTATARADLLAQLDWLVTRAPAAARIAADQIEAHLALLGRFPESAPSIDERFREAAVRFGRDGFVVRYQIVADELIIVRIFHGRQRR